MTIEETRIDTSWRLILKGRLDSLTSRELEARLQAGIGGVTALALDMAGVDYVSSAGLRVLLQAQKVMNRQGSLVIENPGPLVMEVFEITGFADILTITQGGA